MSNATAELLPRALELRSLGLSIIPLRPNKRPLLKTWKEFQSRLANEDEIREWHDEHHPAAFAAVTGAVSRRGVIDFDGVAGESTRTKYFAHITIQVRTPSGGGHAHVIHPGFRVPTLNNKTSKAAPWAKEFPGVDIRGDGGYAGTIGQAFSKVEPGVLRPYETMAPLDQPTPWSELPAEFRRYFEPQPERKPERPTLELLIARGLEQAPYGRNAAGAWLTTQARDNGYTREETLEAVLRYRSQCGPLNAHGVPEEYTEAEVRATVDSIFSRPPRDPWGAGDKSKGEKRGRPKKPSFAESTFEINTAGVFALPKESARSQIWICAPLLIKARTSDEESNSHGRLLEWRDDNGCMHTWAMPMAMLAGDDSEVRARLLDGGLKLAPGSDARKFLSLYLQTWRPDARILCATSIGWHGTSFVLPDKVIPQDSGVIYQSGESDHALRTAGTLEQWRESVARLCSRNSRLVLVVSAAFAGPLLSPLRMESGGLHFVSPTSTGKTTALHAGGSVEGGGTESGFLQSWRHTSNALEGVAAVHNHLTLFLDELAQIDGREANEVAYMLANGLGKGRMNRAIQLRKKLAWNLLFVSSGELTLRDHAADAGRRTKGGASIRILNLPADAGRGFGCFEHLHGIETPDRFARALREAALGYYGTPLRAFLAKLCEHRETVIERGCTYREKFRITVPDGAAGEVLRAADRFAIVGFAGELATQWGITGWPEGEATAAAERCFHAWLKLRGTSGGIDLSEAVRQVRLFIEQHGSSRFQSTRPELRRVSIAAYGTDTIEVPPRPIVNRAGFRNDADDGTVTEYLIFPEIFRNEVCRGFDTAATAAELHRRGFLVKGESDRWTTKRKVPGMQKRGVFYAIKPEILECET